MSLRRRASCPAVAHRTPPDFETDSAPLDNLIDAYESGSEGGTVLEGGIVLTVAKNNVRAFVASGLPYIRWNREHLTARGGAQWNPPP